MRSYDLVVVGGGISGLSAAHFYRAKNPRAKILILENHDDFGGHAKRNEFHVGGRMELINGGTLEIDSPTPYRAVAAGLLKTLGVDPVALTKECNDPKLYESMGLNTGVFFDKETFGIDRLGQHRRDERGSFPPGTWKPFSRRRRSRDKVRQRHRAHRGRQRRITIPASPPTRRRTSSGGSPTSDYLLQVVKADPAAICRSISTRTDGLWGCGIDAVSALDCWGVGLSGLSGIEARARRHGRAWAIRRAAIPPPADRTRSIFRTATPRSRGCWCAT